MAIGLYTEYYPNSHLSLHRTIILIKNKKEYENELFSFWRGVYLFRYIGSAICISELNLFCETEENRANREQNGFIYYAEV